MMMNSWYTQITSVSLYNIFLISLNNIKLNYLFVNYYFACYQPLSICLKHILFMWWAIWQSTNKTLTINNFYYGYVKIHPNLQYLGSILVFYNILNKKKLFNTSLNNIIYILLTSFALGSLWALFQTVWGYYWSNDTIEYILVLFVVFLLVLLHSYYIINSTFKILLLIMTLFLLISLRLNLLYTKHNFFTKLKILKYFIFFLQFVIVFRINCLNKFKQQHIYTKSLVLTFTIIIIFFNKLNHFLIKAVYSYILYYLIFRYYYILIKTNSSKITHISTYTLLSIYNIFLIKYNSSICYIFTNTKLTFSMFLFNKIGILKFINSSSMSATSSNINVYLIKNYDQVSLDVIMKKKICNYF